MWRPHTRLASAQACPTVARSDTLGVGYCFESYSSGNENERQQHELRNAHLIKPHSNGPLVGTLAVDGWAVTFGTARKGLGLPSPYQLHIVQCSIIKAFAL